MKVKELIDALETVNPEKEVFVLGEDGNYRFIDTIYQTSIVWELYEDVGDVDDNVILRAKSIRRM